MTDDPGISDDDLHAFVDGWLDPADHARVAAYLESHPRAAARVAAYRAHMSDLHAQHDDVLAMPVPEAMQMLIARHRAVTRRRRWTLGLAIGAAAILAGWLVAGR